MIIYALADYNEHTLQDVTRLTSIIRTKSTVEEKIKKAYDLDLSCTLAFKNKLIIEDEDIIICFNETYAANFSIKFLDLNLPKNYFIELGTYEELSNSYKEKTFHKMIIRNCFEKEGY